MDRLDPERALALSYAPAEAQEALAAMFALDEALGGILRTTREPLVGQMRLTWWFEALSALDDAPPPAQPILQALATEVLPRGISGAAVAAMVDGWEALLDPDPLTDNRLEAYAAGRGATMFLLAGQILRVRATDPVAAAGSGWALADLAGHCSDAVMAERVRQRAADMIDSVKGRRWSRSGRALGALALIARMNLAASPVAAGAPGRVARLAWHRLTGR